MKIKELRKIALGVLIEPAGTNPPDCEVKDCFEVSQCFFEDMFVCQKHAEHFAIERKQQERKQTYY